MTTRSVDVSMPELMRGITLELRITGARQARARTWLGTRVLELGARVIGCDVEIDAKPTGEDVITYLPLDGGPPRQVPRRRTRPVDLGRDPGPPPPSNHD